jgi:NADH:ubiquinone oxidoreductase subunit 6 (subunit J)
MVNFFAFIAFFSGLSAFSTFSAHTAIYCIILSFLFSGIVYYLLASTYLAMMLFVVYVGAVAMLFVFCVILLNLSSRASRAFSTSSYFFFSFYLLSFFLVSLLVYATVAGFSSDFFSVEFISTFATDATWAPISKDQFLTYSMYHAMLPLLLILGFILFFVTVLVTILFSSDQTKSLG